MRRLALLACAALGACDDPPAAVAPPAPPIESEPLEPPSPPGAALFEEIPPADSGLDFAHRWPPEPGPHQEQLENGLVGGGAAIGDADGDGRPDLYLTRPFGGGRLYRNLGNFRFEDVTRRAGLELDVWTTGASFADVDNDGDLDLAVCGFETPVRLYVNRGDATFVESAAAWGLSLTRAAVTIAFADYDGDGDLDAYLLTNQRVTPGIQDDLSRYEERDGRLHVRPPWSEWVDVVEHPRGVTRLRRAGQRDHLLRNEGGRFQDVTVSAGIEGTELGLGVIWWDYDGDARPDLYVANDFHGRDRLWRNNGDGTFTDAIGAMTGHTPWFSMGVDAGDVNNDGRIDLLATDMAGRTHYKAKMLMGNMGARDAWVLGWGEPRQAMQNALYLNSGVGRYLEAAALAGVASTDWTWAPRLADLDGDGRIDLFVTTGMTRDWLDPDLMRQEEEDGADHVEFWRTRPPRAEPNLAFRNAGDLRFEPADWGLGKTGVSFGAALGDLDGDGDPDLVVNNFDAPASLYRNGSAGRRIKVRLKGSRSIGATVRVKSRSGLQARLVTTARGFESSDEPVLHFGLGNDERVEVLEVRWPRGVQRFTDLAAGRFYTIAEGPGAVSPAPPPMFEASLGPRHRESPFDDFARQELLPMKLSQLGPGIACGDADGDGREELWGAAGRPLPAMEGEAMGALLFDADGDGDADLYVATGSYEFEEGDARLRDRFYLGDGKGGFVEAPLPDLRDSGSSVAAADYDRDGDLDLFVGSRVVPGRYPVGPVSRLLRNEGERFVEAAALQAGMVTGALWSDADNDGWVDLLAATEYGPVRLYRNEGGRLVERTQEAGLERWKGWWNGIAGRDLDRDGDIDYVVTNLGLNTKYRASPEHPLRIYYGAFEPGGRPQIVEAGYEQGTLFPVRGRSCSSRAIPALAAKFTTFDAFAKATLPEIYEAPALEAALRLEADTLESGVLINDGKGVFEFRPLPREAQVSPGFGVALADFEGDGNPDAVLAQNFFGPQPETPRMDGGVGLLLRGRGDGSFETVWPDRSGLVVSGDAKALATLDLNDDGWEDVVVTQNNGEAAIFRNRGTANRILRVKLKGRPGNPTGVGARVTVEGQTAEVYAGSGYLSQSSAELVFGLPEGSATHVAVRWPDGKLVEHAVGLAAGRLELTEP